MDVHAKHEPHIFGCEIGHQDASHRPVHHINAGDVTATDCQISPLHGTSVVELEQVLRIVAKVGVHLEDIVRLMLDSPLKTSDIGSTQALFAFPLDEVDAAFVLALHHLLDDVGSAVGRTVVNDQYLKQNRQFHHSCDDGLDVLFLVVSRNNDQSFYHKGNQFSVIILSLSS